MINEQFKQEEEARIRKIREKEIEKVRKNALELDHDYFILTFKKSAILGQDGKPHFNVETFVNCLPDELVNILVGVMEKKPILEPVLMQSLAVRKSKQKSNTTVLFNPKRKK